MRIITAIQPPDQQGHCAFTDLCQWREWLWCAWRQGSEHASDDGCLAIAYSHDGLVWCREHDIQLPGCDLRDPRLLAHANGELWLLACAATPHGQGRAYQNHLWRCQAGSGWRHYGPVGDKNYWLWGWHMRGNTLIAFAYHCARQRRLGLYQADAEGHFKRVAHLPPELGQVSETSLHLDADNTAHALVRRDPEPGLLIWSQYPWTHWQWREVKQRIAAPQWLVNPDGRYLACSRTYQPNERVALYQGQLGEGDWQECLALPGSGDCGYAGMTRWRGSLWLSYYHSDTGASRVHVLKITEDADGTCQPNPYDGYPD